jgi:hypothetical protein
MVGFLDLIGHIMVRFFDLTGWVIFRFFGRSGQSMVRFLDLRGQRFLVRGEKLRLRSVLPERSRPACCAMLACAMMGGIV